MEVLKLEQAGLFAWSNSKKNKSLFATASVYDSFSSSDAAQDFATLQIYSLDIVNRTSSSQKIGTAKIDELQFTSLHWNSFGEDNLYPHGLIASGFNEGSVGIWDANYIIQNSTGDNQQDINGRGLLCLQNVHSVPVNTIAFNPSKKHLIASGGVEVAIHNIEQDIFDPEVFSPGDNLHEGSIITSVSWNRQVPHILGSASQNGISVVWDLKINKSIFNFSDNSRNLNNRNVSLSWNPEIPTQVAVVYDDEKTPELQIWDLRNPKGPIFCSQRGHTKGIHNLDWCLTDPSLIITTGRDNKACVWNYKTPDNSLVSEYPLDELSSSVQWSPRDPEIFSVTSYSGTSRICSLNNQLNHIPIWLRPPVGARFGFDGRLSVFSDRGGPSIKEYDINLEGDTLLAYIEDFEQNFQSNNVNLKTLCDNRINSTFLEEHEKEEWRFIKAAASGNHDDIIKAVGMDKEKILKQAETYTNKTYTKKAVANKTVDFNYSLPSQQEAEDFFSSLAKQGTEKNAPRKATVDSVGANDEFVVTETITKNTNWNAGTEKIIKENILIGNIEGAVDAALRCGRTAEAFLLAYSKGIDFFRATFEAYVTSCNDSFVKNVIRYLVEDQVSELVQKYALEDWRECVALCLSLSNGNDALFQDHIDELATRFTKVNDHQTALLLFILSKNLSRVLEAFAFRTERHQKGSFDHTIFLMRTVEKLIALKIITNNYEPNLIIDRFLYELTKTLHVYKKDTLILNLLSINNSQGFECLVLRDRLIQSSPSLSIQNHGSFFPFRQEQVNIKVKKAAPVQQRQQQHPQQFQQQFQQQQFHQQQHPVPHQEPQGRIPQQQGPPLQQQQFGKPGNMPGPKPGVSRPGIFNPMQAQEQPKFQSGPTPNPMTGGPGFGHPYPKQEPKDTAPPPIMGKVEQKPGPGPFPIQKTEERPPISMGLGKPNPVQATPPVKPNIPTMNTPNLSSFETAPSMDLPQSGHKTTPFSGGPINPLHKPNVAEPQITQPQPQQQFPPNQNKPTGMPQPKVQQQPAFKPGMPKPLTGPVRTSSQNIGVNQMSNPPLNNSFSSGPQPSIPNTQQQQQQYVQSDSPPIKGGPPVNTMKPGFSGGNQPPFGGPPKNVGPIPTGGPKQFVPPTGGLPNQLNGPNMGGPTGGPPIGGFKPQVFPGKAPMKMPPKMPGYGGGMNQ